MGVVGPIPMLLHVTSSDLVGLEENWIGFG